jgi:hypothetical protein
VCVDGVESATAPFVPRSLRSTVPLERKTHYQLRSAQVRPATGRFVQRCREFIGLGHKMSGASGGHNSECITVVDKCYTTPSFRMPNDGDFCVAAMSEPLMGDSAS